jgi:hypothetical protein
MCSTRDNAALPALGFPIRASAGHWPFSASPRLIAAVHALHRLLVPRHPPCALTILTVILGRALRLCPVIPVSLATVQFSRSAKRHSAPPGGSGPGPASCRRRAGLSKLNSMRVTTARHCATRVTCQIRSTYLVADRARVRSSVAPVMTWRSVPLLGSLERR